MGMYQKLRSRLERANIRPSTRRGQNFLLDSNQLRFIAELGAPSPADVVLEVGPGSGFLTRRLALSGAMVLGVELDRGLLPVAQEETAGLPNVFYLRADILAGKNSLNPEVAAKLRELLSLRGEMLRREGAAAAAPALKAVSNLPYSAGTPFIMNALASDLPWETGVFLLQTEVAERIAAGPGGKNYGAISIAAGLAAATSIERGVGPKCFWPRPNVESSVIRMAFRPPADRMAVPWRALREVTNAVFGSRRKILRNALKGLFPDGGVDGALEELGLDGECRGETLSPPEFRRIAERLEQGRLPTNTAQSPSHSRTST